MDGARCKPQLSWFRYLDCNVLVIQSQRRRNRYVWYKGEIVFL
jgi:hypothetical protein